MAMVIEGFGRRIAREKLAAGDLALCRLSAGTFLVMRVDVDDEYRCDLLLGQVGSATGAPPPRQFPFVRRASGDYVEITGAFKARPIGVLPLPRVDAGPGTLAIDPDGRAYIAAVEDEGLNFIALDVFRERAPDADAEYYPRWEIVLERDGEERVIATFPAPAPLLDVATLKVD